MAHNVILSLQRMADRALAARRPPSKGAHARSRPLLPPASNASSERWPEPRFTLPNRPHVDRTTAVRAVRAVTGRSGRRAAIVAMAAIVGVWQGPTIVHAALADPTSAYTVVLRDGSSSMTIAHDLDADGRSVASIPDAQHLTVQLTRAEANDLRADERVLAIEASAASTAPTSTSLLQDVTTAVDLRMPHLG